MKQAVSQVHRPAPAILRQAVAELPAPAILSQAVIFTHSPIVLAYPDSWIYSLDSGKPERVAYEEAGCVKTYELFMHNRKVVIDELMKDALEGKLFPAITGTFNRSPHTLSWSIAAARKVSQAANTGRTPCCWLSF